MAIIHADRGLKTLQYVEGDKRRGSRGGSLDWAAIGDQLIITGSDGTRKMPQGIKIIPFVDEMKFEGFPENVNVSNTVCTPDGENLIATFRAM